MTEDKVHPNETAEHKVEWKLYRRRWVILFIFFCFSVGNTFQWIQYSIIADIIMKYYNVESIAVDWTSMIFMVTFIPLIFPASFFQDKVGLRWPIILGTLSTAVGACIKIASVGPDLFWVTFVGQTFVAVAQVFMLSVPPSLAAVWFGENEVSTACSIGVFGNQLGIGVGFLLPPMMVHNHNNIDDIGNDLANMFYWSAGFNTAVFILTFIFFQNRPPLPPSPQQALQKENAAGNNNGLFSVMKRLLFNRNYVLLLFAYSINQGVFNALSTLLNQLILRYFKNEGEFAGRVGLTIIFSAMAGSLIFGIILDKTHRYKETTVVVYACSLIGMITFSYTLQTKSQVVVYLMAAVLGFFLEGYMPVGYDFAAELTYPEPEGMMAGIITVPIQIFGTLFTLGYGELFRSIGDEWANNTMSITLLIGTILHVVIKADLKRQAVQSSTTNLIKEPQQA